MVASLAKEARIVRYGKGEAVTRLGQHFHHLAVIADGQIELTVTNREGKRHVLAVLQPGQLYGLAPMLGGHTVYYGATAKTECAMVMVPRDMVLEGMRQSMALMMGVVQVLCNRSRVTVSVMADQHLHSPKARLARHLVMLATTYGVEDNVESGMYVVRFSQSDLSEMLGISRQSLNQAMKELETQGLIQKQYSKIMLTSIEKLNQMVLEQ